MHLTPSVFLDIDGRPFGAGAMSRVISVVLLDKRGFEADELTIELDDHDGSIAIPSLGSKIKVAMGFRETGLIEKGEYLFSEFTASGSPDRLSITARSADLAESLAEQQEKSWHKTTVYEIVAAVAAKHGYQAKIGEVYKKEAVAHIDQTNESDASFLTRLAEQYDAVATVKGGVLLFIPAGGSQTASGAPIAPAVITRADGDGHRFTYSSANAYQAVRAYYTDKASGKKKEVVVNKENAFPDKKPAAKGGAAKKPAGGRKVDTEGQKTKTLRHLYATEAGAWSGARSAFKKLRRGIAEFSVSLAVGRPELFPETPVRVAGFKPEIDAEDWLVAEVEHRLDKSGYISNVTLEARFTPES